MSLLNNEKPYFLLLAVILLSCGTEPTPTYTISSSVTPSEGGSVSQTPTESVQDEGTQVSFTAIPNEGFLFSRWSGGVNSSTNPLSITIDSDVSIVANFERRNYDLTVNIEGQGTVQEEVITAKTTAYPYQTQIKLTAIAEQGWRFKEWQGDLTSTDSTQTISVTEPKTVTAVFERLNFNLTVNIIGEGTVEEVVTAPKTDSYSYETTIELTPVAAEGWKFDGWAGDTTSISPSLKITLTKDTEVTVTFKDVFTLHENGVTIVCDEAEIGSRGEVNGEWYTAVNQSTLFEKVNNEENLSNLCTSNVTWMRSLFAEKFSFNTDISTWDVSNVTDMGELFSGAISFNQDISKWNTSKVVQMARMFSGAQSFNQAIGDWDVSNVSSMEWMFWDATSFNQNLDKWNTSSVSNMQWMFIGATTFNGNISSWDVSNVIDMNHMFYGTPFNGDISEWDVSNVLNFEAMFNYSDFNQPIENWNTSKAIDMRNMFQNTSFNQDISSWDVSNVINMGAMFNGAREFNQNLTSWCVTNINQEPNGFAIGSGISNENKPIWGTCPSN